MADFIKLQKEYAVQILRTHQRTFITHVNAKDAKREFAKNCLVGALEIAIRALEGEVSDSGKTNADRIRAMNDEELADFIAGQRFSVVNQIADKLGIDATTAFIVGRKNALDWLKQEAQND